MGILTSNSYENAWIILGLIVATIASLGIVAATGFFAYTKTPIGQILTKFIYYVPVALLSFGFVADIVSQTFNYSVGGIVGIIAMALNGLVGAGLSRGSVGQAVEKAQEVATEAVSNIPAVGEVTSWLPDIPGPPPPPSAQQGGGAEVFSFPGFGGFDNKYAPQNILVTTTIMFYYMIGQWESGNANRTMAPGLTLLVTVLSQVGIRYTHGCLDPMWAPLVSIAGGIVFGIGGYHAVKAIKGTTDSSKGTTPSSLSGTEAPTDATKPADGSKCSEASGDDFVCDLYKNGELVSTTSS